MTKKRSLVYVIIIVILLLTSCSDPIQTGPVQPDPENPGDITTGKDIEPNTPEVVEPQEPEEPELTEEEKAQLELEKKLAEREELELIRKEELGEFYVPLIPIGEEENKKDVIARGLYITGHTAAMNVDRDKVNTYIEYIEALKLNDQAKINQLYSQTYNINNFEKSIALAAATEINALVINVKNDSGRVTFKSSIEAVNNAGADSIEIIKNIDELMELLDEYEIYTIARIVTFKDKNLAKKMPEHSIQLKSGGIWYDYSGVPWVNPFDKYVWNYNAAIAKEAALVGFDEIQFDYVRFPDNAKYYNPITEFPGRNGQDKDKAISEFLEFINNELEDYNVNIGADVFGLITHNWDDYPEDIGQTWRLMAEYSDVMCPMIYPSHYGTGWYGYEFPDAHPYGVMKAAVQEAAERNASMTDAPEIRPWIQDFTATWVEGYIVYTPKEVRDQIIACKEIGVDGYLVWNPSNSYNPRNFIPTEEEKNTVYPLDRGDKDIRDRTPYDAAKQYLRGQYNYTNSRYWLGKLYLVTPIEERVKDFDEFSEIMNNLETKLIDYEIYEWEYVTEDKKNATIEVYLKYKTTTAEGSEIEEYNTKLSIILENDLWKVKQPSLEKVLDNQ